MTITQNNYQLIQNKFNEVIIFRENKKIAHFNFSKAQTKEELLEILNYCIFYDKEE
jgi:hypothetical protein